MENFELCKRVAELLFKDAEILAETKKKFPGLDVEAAIKEREKLAKEIAKLGITLRPSLAVQNWGKGTKEAMKHFTYKHDPDKKGHYL